MTQLSITNWKFYSKVGALNITDPGNPAPPPDPLPIGLIQIFVSQDVGTPIVPTNWLLCDGDDHPVAMYPDLATALGSNFQIPAPAGGEFRVPNINTAFPLGSGTGAPLGTQDFSLLRSQHSHSSPAHQGAIVGTSHLHDFVAPHTHTIPAHKHNFAHEHLDNNHRHQPGGLVQKRTNHTKKARGTTGLAVADASHIHNAIAGLSSSPLQLGSQDPLLRPVRNPANAPLDTSAVFGGSSSNPVWTGNSRTSAASLVDSLATPNILPPYLNVFFIIKALSDL